MAQVYTAKQQNFLTRFSAAVTAFITQADELQALCNEFGYNGYGVGGANALTDAVVQGILPASTALLVSECQGALVGTSAIIPTITTNRGYLEALRP